MRVGLITPDPGHPLLAATAAVLTAGRHRVEVLDPAAAAPPDSPADVYLLKSRTPQALSLARTLEERGAPVVNSAAATERCQDRTVMASLAISAGLPFAPTRTYAAAARMALDEALLAGGCPVVVKSRHSRKHDLVARLDDARQVREFSAAWPDEPVVVQEFAPNAGWDHKLWAVDGHVFAALRRSELAPDGSPGRNLPLTELPPVWTELVLRVGDVFALDVYGVDVLATAAGSPLIVDVNAFPGIRAQPGAPEALSSLALRTAAAASPTLPGEPDPTSRPLITPVQ